MNIFGKRMSSQNQDQVDNIQVPELHTKEQNSDYYYQTDTNFLENIQSIYQKKISTMKSFFQQSDISEEQCEQIAQYARIHSQANLFNSNSMMNFQSIRRQKLQYCSCGCRRATGQEFSLFANEQKLTFLGPGVILFFFYLRCLKISVGMMLMSFGLFSIISNILSPDFINFNTCSDKSESQKFICQLNEISTYNLKQSIYLRMFQLVLGALVATVWFLGLKFVQFLGEKKNQEIDDLLDSASDYTIRIQNLPFCAVTEKQLIDYIKQLWTTRETQDQDPFSQQENLKLKSIQIIYNMSQCRAMIQKIKNLSLEIYGMIQQPSKIKICNQEIYLQKKKQFETAMKSLQQLRQKFMEDQQYRRSISTTCALVHLHESAQQTKFLDYFQDKNSINFIAGLCNKSKNYTYQGNQVTFTRAPEPSDFNWSNCEIKFSYLRYVFIWAATMVILYAAYALVSYLQTIDYVKRSASILISVIIQVFNRIIWFSLSFLVTLEYNNTKTDSIISLMKKSIFAQVINVIVAPMIGKFLNKKALYGQNSVSSSALFYQFIMFFMMFIFYVANPMYYLKKIMIYVKYFRNKIIKNLCQVVGEIDTIQEIRPVFVYYQGPEFPIAGGYVYMTTAIIHTFFYCHLQPILLLVLIGNISGFYYIMKYLLFRRCKIPQLTDIQIFRVATFAVAYGPFFYASGSIIFILIEYSEDKGFENLNIIQLVPSSILIIIWFLLYLNIGNVLTKINEGIFFFFHFKESFAKASDVVDQNKNLAQIFSQIISNAVEMSNVNEGLACQRKQSYYKNCNVHKLFNFESQLRQTANTETVERTHKLQAFCESQCKKETISIIQLGKNRQNEQQKIRRIEEDLAQMVLVPAMQLKKKNDVKEQVKKSSQSIPFSRKQSNTQISNFFQIIIKGEKQKDEKRQKYGINNNQKQIVTFQSYERKSNKMATAPYLQDISNKIVSKMSSTVQKKGKQRWNQFQKE